MINENLIHCPVCLTCQIEDHDNTAIVHEDRDEYDSPAGTRGGYVEIPLECIMGHQIAVLVGNHKGQHYINVVSR
jgi:hypothetical protein